MNHNFSIILDCFRWVSALLVLLGHARAFYFPPYSELASPGLLDRIFYLVTGLGHQAVMVFFVMSGYLIGMHVIEVMRRQKFHWRNYFSKRIARIFPVLLVALVLGASFDFAGLAVAGDSSVYNVEPGVSPVGVVNYPIEDRLTIGTLVGNVFLLNGILCPPLGSNGPLWSLSMEWFYYLIFPCLCVTLFGWRQRSWLGHFGWLSLLALFAWCLPTEYHLYFVIWLAGITVGYLRLPFWSSILFGALLVHSLLWARMGDWSQLWEDYYIAIAFILLLCALSRCPIALPFERLHRWMAGFSYSLYVLHFPFLVLIFALAEQSLGKDRSVLTNYSLYFGSVLLSCALSYYVSLLTEAKTGDFRRYSRAMIDSLTGSSRAN